MAATLAGQSGSEKTTYTYDGEDKLTEQDSDNASGQDVLQADYHYYQSRGWPNQILYYTNETTPATLLSFYALTYDNCAATCSSIFWPVTTGTAATHATIGDLTGVYQSLLASGSQVTSTVQYSYTPDGLNRLLSATYGGAVSSSVSYAYDLAGNVYSGSSASPARHYDTDNQIASEGALTYAHDGDGNLITGAVTPTVTLAANAYVNASIVDDWSEDNKLLTAQFTPKAGGAVNGYEENGYGVDGLRKWSVADMPGETPALGPTVYYIYSGDTVIGEISSYPVTGANGQVTYTSTPVAAYTWGAGGLVSEHRFVTGTTSTTTTVGSTTTTTYATSAPTAAEVTPTAESFWYAYGPQGETRQLVNASGAIADAYAYTPYGDQAAGSSTGTDPNPFQFGGSVGYYTDPAMQGLVLCGQRWYAPGYARWLSRDPEGYDGGANLYA